MLELNDLERTDPSRSAASEIHAARLRPVSSRARVIHAGGASGGAARTGLCHTTYGYRDRLLPLVKHQTNPSHEKSGMSNALLFQQPDATVRRLTEWRILWEVARNGRVA